MIAKSAFETSKKTLSTASIFTPACVVPTIGRTTDAEPVFGVELLPLAHRNSVYALPTRLAELGLPRWLALIPLVLGLPVLARAALHGRPRLALGSLLLLRASPWLLPWYGVWAISLAAGGGHVRLRPCAGALGLPAARPHTVVSGSRSAPLLASRP